MGLISKSLGINAFSLEDPAQPLLPMSALFDSLGLGRSDAGIMVNEKQALRMTTVFSCVKIISQDLSRISLDIFQDLPHGGRRKAEEHRLYSLLHERPNPNMSSMVWRCATIASMLLWGNAYSWIKRDKAFRVIGLVPMDSARTSPVRIEGKLMYGTTQTDTGAVAYIDPEDVLHFMNFTMDGISGISPIGMCKNAVGIGLAAEKFGAQFFGNGARSTGVLSHPGSLDTEAYENLKKSLHEMANGENSLRPILLEEGMKWEQISVPPNDAQFLETRKFQKEEIAQIFRVPLHLLQDLTRATNANLEFTGVDYTRSCLSPIAAQIEQELNYKLLGGGYSAIHNMMDLQRGDFATLTTSLISLRNSGIYTCNDVLKALNQNPVPTEEGGDIRVVNGTYAPLESLMKQEGDAAKPEGPSTTDSDEGEPAQPSAFRKEAILASYRPLFRDAVGRAINRQDQEFVRKAFQPAVHSMLQTFLASKYGNATVTDTDLQLVGSVVNQIAIQSAGWSKKEASNIATQLTEQVYTMLSEK